MEKNIKEIIKDNKSGSVGILYKTIDIISRYVADIQCFNIDILIKELNVLYYAFPKFSVLFNFTNQLFIEIEKIEKSYSNEEKSKKILKFIDDYKKQWKNVNNKISIIASRHIDFNNKKILLHSNSHTINELFCFLSDKRIFSDLTQTVSSPANEGIIQAKILASLEYKINLISDAAIPKYVEDIDFALLGADTIFEDCFINKIGSMAIVLACNYFKKPVYVIADSRKIINKSIFPEKLLNLIITEKAKPVEEIMKNPYNNISPSNYYYETIPNSLITGFIAETALIKHDGIKKFIKKYKISKLFECK
ncbi:MAG: hypothetical protein KAT68_00815 [Bacteroidales bacterium]|nr:hypothetical protein [Bacteroidales bacterium]